MPKSRRTDYFGPLRDPQSDEEGVARELSRRLLNTERGEAHIDFPTVTPPKGAEPSFKSKRRRVVPGRSSFVSPGWEWEFDFILNPSYAREETVNDPQLQVGVVIPPDCLVFVEMTGFNAFVPEERPILALMGGGRTWEPVVTIPGPPGENGAPGYGPIYTFFARGGNNTPVKVDMGFWPAPPIFILWMWAQGKYIDLETLLTRPNVGPNLVKRLVFLVGDINPFTFSYYDPLPGGGGYAIFGFRGHQWFAEGGYLEGIEGVEDIFFTIPENNRSSHIFEVDSLFH